jgi:hypothetical protein
MNDNEAPTTTRMGFFPLVLGTAVDMQQSGAMAVLARGDVAVSQGGAQMLLAGGNVTIDQGGGQTILSRGDLSIREGGALLAAGATVEVHKGWVGLALGRHIDLTNSRVLLGPLQALSLGAGIGIVATLTKRLFNQSKP